METRYKSQETLTSQIEHFADVGVKEFSKDQEILLKYSQQLAELNNLNQIPDGFPTELKDLIARNKDAYVLFLRKHRNSERTFLEENAVLYNKKFQKSVNELKERIAQADDPKNIPEFLGAGSNGNAYKIQIEGENFVVKFSSTLIQNNFEIKPLIRAKNIPHTPKLIAFSLSDGVKIMTLLPGSEVTSFSPEQNIEYPDHHIIQLIEIVLELEKNGIVIDPKASNFFYDQEEGFSVLDFHLSNGTRFTEPQQQVMSLVNALSARKFPNIHWEDKEAYEKQKIEKGLIFLPTLIRFIKIINQNYPELLAIWKQQYDEDVANPRVSNPGLVNRDNWQTDNPKINEYLSKLKEMGY